MTALDSADINEYLQTRSDFGLEIFVYRSFIEAGFLASHGGAYLDTATGKHRQFDVRAVAMPRKEWTVYFAVECKSLTPESPLVVSRVPRADTDSYHEVICSRVANAFEVTRQNADSRALALYPVGEPVGKRTGQPRRDQSGKGFKDEERDSYEKWSQALASAAALVVDHCQRVNSSEWFAFVMPILVVNDGTLWVADYDDDGKQVGAPKPADEATLFVDRDIRAATRTQSDFVYHMSHLHIFTRTGFTRFLVDVNGHTRQQLTEKIFGHAQRHALATWPR